MNSVRTIDIGRLVDEQKLSTFNVKVLRLVAPRAAHGWI